MLCADCLHERRRQEKLENLQSAMSAAELSLESVDDLDEIEVPDNADISTEELQEIDKEFDTPDFSPEIDEAND
jgi:hypothetical protein